MGCEFVGVSGFFNEWSGGLRASCEYLGKRSPRVVGG